MRAMDEAYAIMGPTTIRESQDQIPTIDERGNPRIVICTRTLETVLGSVGPTEVERGRRHTLPGYGHVRRVSDTEFEVFHGRAKLMLDIAALHPDATTGGVRSEQAMRQQPPIPARTENKSGSLQREWTRFK
jgi:hypothetical protein